MKSNSMEKRLGTLTLPREKVKLLVPRITRFEKHLSDTLKLRAFMDANRGEIPGWFQSLPAGEKDKLITTMHNLEIIEKFIARFRAQPERT